MAMKLKRQRISLNQTLNRRNGKLSLAALVIFSLNEESANEKYAMDTIGKVSSTVSMADLKERNDAILASYPPLKHLGMHLK